MYTHMHAGSDSGIMGHIRAVSIALYIYIYAYIHTPICICTYTYTQTRAYRLGQRDHGAHTSGLHRTIYIYIRIYTYTYMHMYIYTHVHAGSDSGIMGHIRAVSNAHYCYWWSKDLSLFIIETILAQRLELSGARFVCACIHV